MNKIPYIMRDESITVFFDGTPHTINNTHVNFRALRQAILDANYDAIPSLLSIEKKIEDMTFGNIKIRDGKLYYHNTELHGVVVQKLLKFLKEGSKDAMPLVNFIERIMRNPSANSTNELYTFLSYKDLPITPEGKFLAYKGVKKDYYSKSASLQTTVLQGKVNEAGEIYNGVGETIVVARNQVDDNKEHHCSFGLHAGSYDYANNWAGKDGRLLVVEIDPADAVSVPTDCSFQKLRTCAYKVIGDITETRREIPDAVYSGSDDADDSSDWSDSCADCEEGSCGCDIDYSDGVFEVENYVLNQWKFGNVAHLSDAADRLDDVGLGHLSLVDILETLNMTYIKSSEYGSEIIVQKDNHNE